MIIKTEDEQIYEVVSDNVPFAPRGTKLFLIDSFYVNKEETIAIKSTNFTGRIIKKIKNAN